MPNKLKTIPFRSISSLLGRAVPRVEQGRREAHIAVLPLKERNIKIQ